MSITKKIEPNKIQPAYNEIISVISSNRTLNKNFVYITEIFVDGVFAAKIKTPTRPDGYGVVDVHRHLENHVKFPSDFDFDSTDAFIQGGDAYADYSLYYGEEYFQQWTITSYSNSGGYSKYTSVLDHDFEVGQQITFTGNSSSNVNSNQIITSIPSSKIVITDLAYDASANNVGVGFKTDNSTSSFLSGATSTGKSVWNGVESYRDYINYDYTNYVISGTSSEFLSSLGGTYEATLEDRDWLFFYNSISGNATSMEVVSDNGAFLISNPYSAATSSTGDTFCWAAVGPWNLQNTTGDITVISGSTPIIDSSTTQYTVRMVDASNNGTSQTKTFNIKDVCGPYEKYRLIFLDKKGSLITFVFDLVSRQDIRLKKRTYRGNYGDYDETTNTWGYKTTDRGRKNYDTEINEEITITSNWIDESYVDIVSDLIQSPEVYHLDEDGNIYPINITTSSYEKKKRVNDKLINYDITFEYAYHNTVQRG